MVVVGVLFVAGVSRVLGRINASGGVCGFWWGFRRRDANKCSNMRVRFRFLLVAMFHDKQFSNNKQIV